MLNEAIINDSQESFESMLDSGAGLGIPYTCGCSPLLLALQNGRVEMARTMILRGFSTVGHACNFTDYPGASLLQYAILSNIREDTLRLILEKEAPGDCHVAHIFHPLHCAIACGNMVGLACLIRHYQIDVPQSYMDTKPSYHEHESVGDTSRRLQCPRIRGTDRSIINISVDKSKLHGLLRINDSYTAERMHGVTCLRLAVWTKRKDACCMLLDAGADVDSLDRDLRTPLFDVAASGSINLVKFLISRGANINSRSSRNVTPITSAAMNGQFETFLKLERHGADMCITGNDARNILLSAAFSCERKLFTYLFAKGFERWWPKNPTTGHPTSLAASVMFAIATSDHLEDLGYHTLLTRAKLSMLKQLLRGLPRDCKAMKNIDSRPLGVKPSPLCRAAVAEHMEAMILLIAAGADVIAEGCDDGTALMAACEAGRLSAIKFLIHRGAKVSYSTDERVVSALAVAKHFPEICEWLLVGRYTEQLKIDVSGQTGPSSNVVQPWLGLEQRRIPLTGEYGRFGDETMLEYACRLNRLRRGLEGKVLHWAQGHEYPFVVM